MAAGLAVPILLGAAIGFLALRDGPQVVTLSVLAPTGGALAAVVVEENAVFAAISAYGGDAG